MKRTWFVGLFLFVISPVYAVYDILLENDTSRYLVVDSGAVDDIASKYFGGDHFYTMRPYERKKVQWFSYNSGIKNGHFYRFYVNVYDKQNLKQPMLRFDSRIKGAFYGSSIISVTVKQQGLPVKGLFEGDPRPHFAKIHSLKLNNVFNENQSVDVRAAAIKYTYPNSHKNIQLTDAISFVISEKQPQYHYTANHDHLTMATYNVQLWPMYGRVGGVKLNHPHERVKEIAKKLSQYDVVTVQEVFSRDHRATLTDAMRADYPYSVQPKGGNRVFKSGVVIYSRWPILAHDATIYRHCEGIDCAAAKGVSYAKINKYGKIYNIFSTHFQSGGDGNGADGKKGPNKEVIARLGQMHQMTAFIRSKQIPKDEAVIISGDLNIDAIPCFGSKITPHCEEYKHLLSTLNATYVLHENAKVMPYTVDNVIDWMGHGDSQKILDYILASDDYRVSKSYHSRVMVLRGDSDPDMFTGGPYGDTDLSDHFALEASLTF